MCDRLYPLERIEREHGDYRIWAREGVKLWEEGINTMTEDTFIPLGRHLLDCIETEGAGRAFIISYNGSITSYRQLLGEPY